MKKEIEKQFIRLGRRREIQFQNEQIALRPREYSGHVSSLDGCCSMVYDLIDLETGRVAGELALRLGEGPALFYLGHVGYHVDPPYQGRHYALQACRLALPVFREFGLHSFVITTDDDNWASIRTCERLGCRLESVVEVPGWCRSEFSLSERKRRYIFASFSDESRF
ncbi:MAG: GNAT family N-acetyltransferase [Candidatus Limiplasma sp.]|nr:GNAT family N-acetyltransferase [Clostridiales bacterium]MDY4063397.1 GNAT family N-acetyltransferase [Candidatus Limiplasma sp.]